MMGKIASGSLRFIPFQLIKQLRGSPSPYQSEAIFWPILSYITRPGIMWVGHFGQLEPGARITAMGVKDGAGYYDWQFCRESMEWGEVLQRNGRQRQGRSTIEGQEKMRAK